MLRLKQIKLNKIKTFFQKLPRFLGERFFTSFLVLLLLALIFGGFIFYKYSVLIEQASQQDLLGEEKPLDFDERIFQEILKIWQERQKKFEEAQLREYPDPFGID